MLYDSNYVPFFFFFFFSFLPLVHSEMQTRSGAMHKTVLGVFQDTVTHSCALSFFQMEKKKKVTYFSKV